MRYAKVTAGVPSEIAPGAMVRFTREGGEFFTSVEAITSWVVDEQEAIGVYPIIEPTVPNGQRIVSTSLRFDNGEVFRDAEFEDVPPPPVPEIISDRQFFQQLAILGLITEEEALAAVMVGTVPPAIEAFISALPEGYQFDARMKLSGAIEFHRSVPLTVQFIRGYGAANDMNEAQADAFGDQLWRDAAALV